MTRTCPGRGERDRIRPMNANERRLLEQRSSAYTLSDMELFVFPELMLALLLANLMSPRIWRWREDPWFARREKKLMRRIARLKQYIMDHYVFNLDLETWGLTTKERELSRFRDFVDEEALRQSNALFGYEGDRYYFDLDIRSHFGLDRYTSNVIPYWKTETVEAMDAFRYRPGFQSGAGECVSLAALYAAALFLVSEVPLEDIFMMATPLHSQNFVDVEDGLLTNNRRLVTKAMWTNGTALSAQARRALEHERVTIVAHETGVIHVLYPEATIDRAAYERFDQRLRAFLHADFSPLLLGHFLRSAQDLQRCFQIRHLKRGIPHYVAAEKVFAFERDSAHLFTGESRGLLLDEVDDELFQPAPIPDRIVYNDLEAFVQEKALRLDRPDHVALLRERFACDCFDAQVAIDALIRFCHVNPRLPDPATKRFLPSGPPLNLSPTMGREALVARVETLRAARPVADLAFYAYRDLNRTEDAPFLKAAVERSPVCLAGTKALAEDELPARVQALDEGSIYDEPGRLAQPDEVWNFGRGDGIEKAVLLGVLMAHRRPGQTIRIGVEPRRAVVQWKGGEAAFDSVKELRAREWSLVALEEATVKEREKP